MRQYERNLYVLCFAIFLASVSWCQVMPFLPLFLKEMGVKRNLIQWSGYVFAAQSLASIVAVPFWSRLGDRHGRKPMTLRAGICLAGIYFGMSVCQTPMQLAILRFLNGALTGFIPGAIALIATGTPQDRAPRAVATAQTASATGQIVGPGIGGLLAGIFGYRGAMTVSGTAVVISVLLVWLFVRETGKVAADDGSSLLDDFVLAFRSPVLSSLMLVVMVNGFVMASLAPLLALHLGKIGSGAPDWFTGFVFSLPAAAFVLSAHRWSLFGERRGYHRAITTGFAGGALFVAVLAGVHSIWLFAALYFALGLCVAAVAPSTGAVICTRVPDEFRGRAYGMQSSAVMLGGLVAPVTATQLAAHLGIPSVFIGAGLLYLAGLALFRTLVPRWEHVPDRAG